MPDKKNRLDLLDDIKPEDLPVEEFVDLFAGMPCEFTWDDFRGELRAFRRKEAKRRKPV